MLPTFLASVNHEKPGLVPPFARVLSDEFWWKREIKKVGGQRHDVNGRALGGPERLFEACSRERREFLPTFSVTPS